MIKIIGITISVLSLVIALFGVFALVNANEMAQILSLAINEFENAEWQAH